MRTVLLTGATGFVGRNIRPFLEEKYHVLAPNRQELDLRSRDAVYAYLSANPVDVVFHCATPNSTRNAQIDLPDKLAEDTIRVFLNLTACREFYGKMIYMGSGAEHDKTQEIINIQERECTRALPQDSYGLAKYVMHRLAEQEDRVYNLCLFGCYGPGDHWTKFITHCIRSCLHHQNITIRQDCKFDYIHVYDVAQMLIWLAEHNPRHRMYNASGCQHAYLSELADMVKRQMKSDAKIKVLSPGYNREYTCDGSRFWNESGLRPSYSLEKGIELQIAWEKEHWEENKSERV